MGLNQVQDAGDHISYGPKGSLSKRLKDWKETFVNKHMFGNVVAPEGDLYPLSHPRQLYELEHNAVQSLGPGSWIFEHVIDAYMLLLRDREEYYRSRGIQRWSQFGFMNSFFMHLGQSYVPCTNVNTMLTKMLVHLYTNANTYSCRCVVPINAILSCSYSQLKIGWLP